MSNLVRISGGYEYENEEEREALEWLDTMEEMRLSGLIFTDQANLLRRTLNDNGHPMTYEQAKYYIDLWTDLYSLRLSIEGA